MILSYWDEKCMKVLRLFQSLFFPYIHLNGLLNLLVCKYTLLSHFIFVFALLFSPFQYLQYFIITIAQYTSISTYIRSTLLYKKKVLCFVLRVRIIQDFYQQSNGLVDISPLKESNQSKRSVLSKICCWYFHVYCKTSRKQMSKCYTFFCD